MAARASKARQAAEADKLIGDAVGQLMEFWGFRKNIGRIWSLLYLEPQPLSAPEIMERLRLAAGTVSLSLADLMHWGAIRKVYREGERRDYYEAETDLWRLLTGVLAARERRLLEETRHSIARAKEALDALGTKDANQAFKLQRVLLLGQLTEIAATLLDQLLEKKKIDVMPFLSLLGKKD